MTGTNISTRILKFLLFWFCHNLHNVSKHACPFAVRLSFDQSRGFRHEQLYFPGTAMEEEFLVSNYFKTILAHPLNYSFNE